MKKLAGIVIVLAALILGGYYGMGVLTERTIKKNMNIINQSNGLFADVTDYKRGWFQSEAIIHWRLHVPERVIQDANGQPQTVAAQDYKLDMPIKIHHGPFIFANDGVHFGMGYANSDIKMPQEFVDQFDTLFTKESTKPQLDFSIAVGYLNKSTVGLSLPQFKLITKEGQGTFDWMGMDSSTSVSSNMDKVSGDVVLEGMTFNKDDTKVEMGKATTSYSLHEALSGLFLGDATLDLPSLMVTVKEKKMFELKDFSLSSSSDVDDHLFSSHLTLSVESVLANDQKYGPAEIEIALRNIDADVLARINQQAQKMQHANDAEKQQAMLMMLPELPKLLDKGAEFEVSKLRVGLPQGTIDGNMMIVLPAGGAANPFQMMQKVKGNAKISVPVDIIKFMMTQSLMSQMDSQPEMQQALIQEMQQANTAAAAPSKEDMVKFQMEKQLSAMQESGLLVLSGTDYTLEASFGEGKFVVNGKPFDPSMMKF